MNKEIIIFAIYMLIMIIMVISTIYTVIVCNRFSKNGMKSFLDFSLAMKDKGIDLIVFRCKDCAEDLEKYNTYIYEDGTTIPLDRIKVIIVDNHDTECEMSEHNLRHNPQKFTPIRLRNKPSSATKVKDPKTTNSCIKPKLKFKDGHMNIVNKWVNGEISSKEAADQLHISMSSLYRYFGELKRSAKQ